MNAATVSIAMAGCMLGGIAAGWGLRAALPEHHLADESKDTVKVTTGLIATLTALVLGLLVSSANSTFNTQRNEAQKTLQASAQDLAESLAHTRWLITVQQEDDHIPMAFVAVLAVWTCAIFASFSLFAPRNVTTTTALLVCVLSVAGAVFLILELGDPFGGVVSMPTQPLHTALEHLGR